MRQRKITSTHPTARAENAVVQITRISQALSLRPRRCLRHIQCSTSSRFKINAAPTPGKCDEYVEQPQCVSLTQRPGANFRSLPSSRDGVDGAPSDALLNDNHPGTARLEPDAAVGAVHTITGTSLFACQLDLSRAPARNKIKHLGRPLARGNKVATGLM
jgi:hypothetical protein